MAYVPRRRRSSRPSFSPFSGLNRQKLLMYAVFVLIGMIVLGYIAAFGLFAWYSRDLPQPGKLSESRGSSTIFYDRNDEIIYEMYKDSNRVPVKSDDISEHLKQATVAIEDKRFYEHHGISEYGILRAAFNSLLGNPQGGSTITQQLIKNVLLTSERRLSRKIKEAILAYQVEKKYSKDEILEMYLNEAPYGGTFVGVGSASMGYFGKAPKDLTLLEAAILAGLPQNPTSYSPFIGKKDAWKGRAQDVLRRMQEDGYITKEEKEKAVAQLDQIKFSSPKLTINAPHFIFYIRKLIEDQYGQALLAKGVKVKTTLDLELQKKAEKIVKDQIEDLGDYDVGNGALVALDPETGEIITYVGSYDYNNDEYGKYDVVSQGNRQPGSTLKPIEYAVALKKGYTAASVIMDVKTEFPNSGQEKSYMPVNYDGKYRGPVQMRFALGNSLNVPAVKMLAMLGLRDFLQQAYDMGIDSLEPTTANMNNLGLSASLGGGETTLLDLAQAFSVFANGGNRIEPAGILEITEFNGKKIYEKKDDKRKEVLAPAISFIISHILSDNNARVDTFGPRSYLNISGKTVAVKSGTTDDKRDNWAVGFTKGIVLGVWVGNNDNSKMNPSIASGSTGASPIWHDTMIELLKKYDDGIIEKPSDVEAVEVDSLFGGLPKESNSKRSEYFIKGTAPTEISSFYKKLKLSKSNGKIANEVEVRNGNYDEKDFYVVIEKDPISGDGKNRWQEAIDAWAREQGDERWHYPTETSDSSAEDVVVSIKNPGNETKVETSDKKIEVRARITSLASIKEIKIWINGAEKKVLAGDRDEIVEVFELENGKYEIKVRAENDKGKTGESTIKIGVNEDWK